MPVVSKDSRNLAGSVFEAERERGDGAEPFPAKEFVRPPPASLKLCGGHSGQVFGLRAWPVRGRLGLYEVDFPASNHFDSSSKGACKTSEGLATEARSAKRGDAF